MRRPARAKAVRQESLPPQESSSLAASLGLSVGMSTPSPGVRDIEPTGAALWASVETAVVTRACSKRAAAAAPASTAAPHSKSATRGGDEDFGPTPALQPASFGAATATHGAQAPPSCDAAKSASAPPCPGSSAPASTSSNISAWSVGKVARTARLQRIAGVLAGPRRSKALRGKPSTIGNAR